MPGLKPTRQAYLDPEVVLEMFQAHVCSRDDGGIHASGLDHFQAAAYQVFILVHLVRTGAIRIQKGRGSQTDFAKACRQLVECGFAIETSDVEDEEEFQCSVPGMDLVDQWTKDST